MSGQAATSLLSRIGVAQRLWLAVGVVALGLIGIVMLVGARSGQLQAMSDAETDRHDAKAALVSRWSTLASTNAARQLAMALSTDAMLSAAFEDGIASTSAEINKTVDALEKQELDSAEQKLIQRTKEQRDAMRQTLGAVRSASDAAAANDVVKQKFEPAQQAYLASLREFLTHQDELKAQLQQHIGDLRRQNIMIAALGIGALLLLVSGGAALLIRSIQQPLGQAIGMARRIAGGDLTSRAHSQRQDEFGQLLGALDEMVAKLRTVVGEVRQGVESVSSASAEIANGNQDLSARTEQTASNLEQTASSMEELTGTVSNSADVARQANQLAHSAAESAARGRRRGGPGRQQHGRDHRQLAQDRRHHWRDRRHCLPDQHPGAERRCGSGACR
ncbi:methyl-accepting chemotaxis protein [Burkholderiaceae bacterium UC74_6]